MCDPTPDTPKKQCKKCKRWLAEDKAHFFYGKSGIPYSPCKECRGLAFTVTTNKKRKASTREGYAWCTQCDLELEITKFTAYKNGKIDSRCRSCRQINKKNRRLQQPDIVRMEDKLLRERRRDKRTEEIRLWREKNREHVISYHKKHNATPERRAQKKARRQRSDVQYQMRMYGQEYSRRPDVVLRRKERNRTGIGKIIKQRYRARQLSLPHNFSKHDWDIALHYFGNCCAVCGRPRGLWHTLAADHWIPLSAGIEGNPGTVAINIVPLCHGRDGCNNSKSDKMPMDWLTQRFGTRQAKVISNRIESFFKSIRPN